MQLKHLRLEIFLTFSSVFWDFEAHFLIKIFLIKRRNVYCSHAAACCVIFFYFIQNWKLTIFFILPIFPSIYGTIIRTEITWKKNSCYMSDSTCRRLIVESPKIFESYVKHFWIFSREIICKILIGLCE